MSVKDYIPYVDPITLKAVEAIKIIYQKTGRGKHSITASAAAKNYADAVYEEIMKNSDVSPEEIAEKAFSAVTEIKKAKTGGFRNEKLMEDVIKELYATILYKQVEKAEKGEAPVIDTTEKEAIITAVAAKYGITPTSVYNYLSGSAKTLNRVEREYRRLKEIVDKKFTKEELEKYREIYEQEILAKDLEELTGKKMDIPKPPDENKYELAKRYFKAESKYEHYRQLTRDRTISGKGSNNVNSLRNDGTARTRQHFITDSDFLFIARGDKYYNSGHYSTIFNIKEALDKAEKENIDLPAIIVGMDKKNIKSVVTLISKSYDIKAGALWALHRFQMAPHASEGLARFLATGLPPGVETTKDIKELIDFEAMIAVHGIDEAIEKWIEYYDDGDPGEKIPIDEKKVEKYFDLIHGKGAYKAYKNGEYGLVKYKNKIVSVAALEEHYKRIDDYYGKLKEMKERFKRGEFTEKEKEVIEKYEQTGEIGSAEDALIIRAYRTVKNREKVPKATRKEILAVEIAKEENVKTPRYIPTYRLGK